VHLSKVFKPNSQEITLQEKNRLLFDDTILAARYPYNCALLPFTVNEVKAEIKYLNPKKTAGYDLITNQILEKRPEMGIKYITQLYNRVLLGCFFPPQ